MKGVRPIPPKPGLLLFARPGNYQDYLRGFRLLKTEQLEEINRELNEYKYGASWPRSNYRSALTQVLKERG